MFGKGKRAAKRLLETGKRVPAVIVDVELGRFITNTNSGVGGSLESTSAKRTVKLRVEPPGESAYNVTLKLDRSDPQVPLVSGTRTEVLVDPQDASRVALMPEATYTLPGGGTWQPDSDLAKLANSGDVDGLLRELGKRAKPADPNDQPDR
jgi:hypothetical protein